MTSPRSVAAEVVRRVAGAGGYSNLILRAELDRSGLVSRDRALATELAYGTLRRLVPIDWVLASFIERKTPRPTERALLRLGVYQLLFTRIPPHAAVGETAALAHPHARGFVNAVLRRVAAEPPPWPSGSTDEEVAVRTGLAPWAVRELRAIVGDGDVEAAAAALATPARLTLRTNGCRITVEELERALSAAGFRSERGRIHPGSLVVDGGSPLELPGFADGWFAVQDQASSFVVSALDPRPGDLVLDPCAGPGGKAGHIACLIQPGGTLVAADASSKRAALVRRTLERLVLPGLVVAQDARRPAIRGPFDRILVDAPCSGIGSARRRPELLWRPREDDLHGFGALQLEIASAAAALLAPGGRLVYSVCTFPRAETDGVVEALLAARPELEPEPIAGPDGSAARIRLWPHRHETDAMFVAAFRRRATAPG